MLILRISYLLYVFILILIYRLRVILLPFWRGAERCFCWHLGWQPSLRCWLLASSWMSRIFGFRAMIREEEVRV